MGALVESKYSTRPRAPNTMSPPVPPSGPDKYRRAGAEELGQVRRDGHRRDGSRRWTQRQPDVVDRRVGDELLAAQRNGADADTDLVRRPVVVAGKDQSRQRQQV